VTFYYAGGSAGTALTAWFWLKGGWPACVGLFAAASLFTLILGLAGGKSAVGREIPPEPVVDMAI
jgi:hypothetical protein